MTALLALALAAPPADPFGDPLPAGATARVGTTRLWRPNGWAGAVLTPDSRFLLAPTRDGPVERWDVTTGRVVGTVGEKREVPADHEYLSLSADGRRLLSLTGTAATVRDAATGRVLTEVVVRVGWTDPTARATAALSADGTALAFVAEPADGEKRTAVVWDVGGARRRLDVQVDDRHPGVALSADGKVLATWGAVDSPVQFWHATTGKKLGAVTLEGVRHTAVGFAPDGRAALTDREGWVRRFDPGTGREVGRLGVRADASGDLRFSPDGKRLAVGYFHGTVRVWDVGGDEEVGHAHGPVSTRGVAVVFAGGDRLVAWGGDWQKAVVWEVPSGKRRSPAGSGAVPGSLAFTPDGKELVTVPAGYVSGPGWTVRRWDPATGRPVGEWKFGDGRAGSDVLNLFPGGTAVRAGWAVYDPRTGKKLHALDVGGRPDAPHLDAAGELLLTPVRTDPARRPGPTEPVEAEVKELATGKVLAVIGLPGPGLKHAVRTPDRGRLVTAVHLPAPSGSGVPSRVAVTLWDLATGKKLGGVTEPGGTGSLGLAAGPDGKTAVLTEGVGGLRVLDLTAGKVVRRVETGDPPRGGPVATPDGKRFAVAVTADPGRREAGEGCEVRVYETATGKLLKAFRGHAGAVTALAFSPDGKTLASGSWDTTVLLWDPSTIGK